ncbi:MAG: hypothetical protein ACKN9T_10560 [Candidatus Methylumidiphilus sp.]
MSDSAIEKIDSGNPTPVDEPQCTPVNSTEMIPLATARIQDLEAIKRSIERLLGYAVAAPDIAVEESLLKQAIKVLRKPCGQFTEEDEFLLWDSQAQLSKLVKPATDLSIQIAQQLNDSNVIEQGQAVTLWQRLQFWRRTRLQDSPTANQCQRELRLILVFLVGSVFIYVVIQAHCALLSAALAGSNKYMEEWKSQQQLISNMKLTTDEPNAPQSAQLEGVRESLNLLRHQLSASSQALIDLTKPMTRANLLISDSSAAMLAGCQHEGPDGKDAGNHPVELNLMACLTFEREYASSLYIILSRYILPLVLGMIGATAYVVRRTLNQLETNSYLPATHGKLLMRLCLGALLGAISGIFLSDDSAVLQSFNLSLIMIALLMGYSVEVAFGLFDSVIDRMRDWAGSLRPAPTDPSKKLKPGA